MKKLLLIILIANCFVPACRQETSGWKPTGVTDIDEIRMEITKLETTAVNALERRASLYRWWRFMWRQGYNMHSFDSIANDLVNYADSGPEAIDAINRGYTKLEKMSADPDFIEEVRGTEILETNPGQETSYTDWPVYHGTDGSQNGFSPDAGPSEGRLAWRFPKGISWYARPVVENGRVYVSSPGIDVYGYCLDENSGEILWKGRQYGLGYYNYYGSRHEPVVTANRVMFRTGHRETLMFIHEKSSGSAILMNDLGNKRDSSPKGKSDYTAYIENGRNLVVADARTGTVKWRFPSGENFSGEPRMAGDNIYASSTRGMVYCFKTSSPEPVWERDLESEVRGKPGVGNGHLYIGGKDGRLFTLDAEDGSIQWVFESNNPEPRAWQYFATPIESGGRIYAGTAGSQLLCLDAGTGIVIWKRGMNDWIRSAPLIIDGVIYTAAIDGSISAIRDLGNTSEEIWTEKICPHGITADLTGTPDGILAGGRNLILYSVDPASGQIQWRHGILDGAWVGDRFVAADWTGGLQPSPVISEGILYIGGSDGFVNAIDAETGKEIWKFETRASVSLSPTVADGKVYFSHLGGTSEHYSLDIEPAYYALDKNTGKLIWESNEYGMVWVGSAYADNTLFFGNCDGFFFGVDARSGKKLWEYNSAINTPHEGRPLDGTFIHGFPPGVYCNPVADDTRFYSGSWSGYYYAFDRKGNMIWRTQTNNGNLHGGLPDSSAPVLWKDHLYVQKIGHSLAAINIYTGQIDWEWTGMPGFLQNGTVAAHQGRIFGSVTRRATMLPYNVTLIAFNDLENGGEILWKYRGGGGLTTPVLTEDKLVFGSTGDVFLTCLDPATGDLKWRFYTGGEMMENSPALYNDKFYAHCKDGWLYAIR